MPWRQAAALASSAGGRPYAGSAGKWNVLPADGSGPSRQRGRERPKKGEILLRSASGVERLQPGEWVAADLRDLIVTAPLREGVLTRLDEIVVVAPGVLGRTLLSRATHLGFAVEIAPVGRRPLLGEHDVSSAVLLRVSGWPVNSVPRAFLDSLTRLPYTAVARGEALLVDVRYEIPLSSVLVASLVPDGE
ncbi:MAG: hypothetical protein GY856_37050, partial [bacterium]|nr:hypothetical protein [bacterium]